MHGILLFLIFLGIGCLVCGPIALIISIIALKSTRTEVRRPIWQEENTQQRAA